MAEPNEHKSEARSATDSKGSEHSVFIPSPLPVILNNDKQEAKEGTETDKATSAQNLPMVDSVPIFVRQSTIDAELESMKKARISKPRPTSSYSARLAASRLQEYASNRPISSAPSSPSKPVVATSAAVLRKPVPLRPASSSENIKPSSPPSSPVASNVAQSGNSASKVVPRRPVPLRPASSSENTNPSSPPSSPVASNVAQSGNSTSKVVPRRPVPLRPALEAKPLERPLDANGVTGPRALVTPTKARSMNSLAARNLAIHAAPSSVAKGGNAANSEEDNSVSNSAPLRSRTGVNSPFRSRSRVSATSPSANRSQVSSQSPSAHNNQVSSQAPNSGATGGENAIKATRSIVGTRNSIVANKNSTARPAPVSTRPPVVAGKPVPREQKQIAGAVVAGKPVSRQQRQIAGAVIAGRPNPTNSAPVEKDASKNVESEGASENNKGNTLAKKRGLIASSGRKRANFLENEPDLSKLPWKDAMLKLAAVPLMSDFLQVDEVMFEILTNFVKLEMHTLQDYLSSCYCSDGFSCELSCLSEQYPILLEAYDRLPVESIGGEVEKKAESLNSDKDDEGERDKCADKKSEEKTDIVEKDGAKTENDSNKISEDSSKGEDIKDSAKSENAEDCKEGKGTDSNSASKLVLAPQAVAVNSGCCQKLLKIFFPDIKNSLSEILINYYVEGGRKNPEGKLPEIPIATPEDKEEKQEVAPDKESPEDKVADNKEEQKLEEDVKAESEKSPVEPANNLDDVLNMIDNFDFGDMLGKTGDISLGKIELDDLSIDDLLNS